MVGRLQTEVISALEMLGSSTASDVGRFLRDTGAVLPNSSIRQTLRRLHVAGVVRQPAYGRYELASGYKLRGESVEATTVRAIRRYLLDVGGIARKKDINEAVWGKPVGAERNADYRRVVRALQQFDGFRQDFGRGVWNLPLAELERLPRTGFWAERIAFVDCDGPGVRKAVDDGFSLTGSAFMDARRVPVEDLVELPAVQRELRTLAALAPSITGRVRAEEMLSIPAKGEALPAVVLAGLYIRFETGSPQLHRAAPASFYRVCAAAFGVCSASLSRGLVRKKL